MYSTLSPIQRRDRFLLSFEEDLRQRWIILPEKLLKGGGGGGTICINLRVSRAKMILGRKGHLTRSSGSSLQDSSYLTQFLVVLRTSNISCNRVSTAVKHRPCAILVLDPCISIYRLEVFFCTYHFVQLLKKQN